MLASPPVVLATAAPSAPAPWVLALLAVALLSALSLAGAVTFVVRAERLQSVLHYLVSLAAGALLGNACFHLLPELAEDGLSRRDGALVLTGIAVFFAFERFVHWHHHGHAPDHAVVAPYAWLNLLGDGLHNFVDGVIIATAFLQDVSLGFATTAAVALHEIPQELGDLGILLHAGLSRSRALLLNLAASLTALLGAVFAITMHGRIAAFEDSVLAITAGGFVYIAAADLIPELHRERRPVASLLQFACLAAGMALMGLSPHSGH